MDYMALYYSKEAECQQKDVKIAELEAKIHNLKMNAYDEKREITKRQYLWLKNENA